MHPHRIRRLLNLRHRPPLLPSVHRPAHDFEPASQLKSVSACLDVCRVCNWSGLHKRWARPPPTRKCPTPSRRKSCPARMRLALAHILQIWVSIPYNPNAICPFGENRLCYYGGKVALSGTGSMPRIGAEYGAPLYQSRTRGLDGAVCAPCCRTHAAHGR